jgi:hypothetical protein
MASAEHRAALHKRRMIERYTIKFGPAVSQKELEKLLHTGEATLDPKDLHKMKARIEVVADFDDLKKIDLAIRAMKDLPAKYEPV